MADWIGNARSNYFRVKDESSFLTWAQSRSLEVWDQSRDGVTYFAIRPDASNEFGDWPRFISRHNDDDETSLGSDDVEPEELDLATELSIHLQDGSVAVLMDSGAEGLRRVTGRALAINNKGEAEVVDLDDIYEKASALGTEILSI